MLVVASPDKFRGTATAHDVAAAIAVAAAHAGHRCEKVPLADGGEGTLEVLGGANRSSLVTGPLGDPVVAGWRLARDVAVIEMARASGLDVVGGPETNDPIAASTYGTGELIVNALESGARRIIVAVGGSATTDGGLGALRAMYPLQRFRGVELCVACDVRTSFVDAATVFAPQKGASGAQVELLRRRLERLAQVYLEEHGIDVRALEGAGAAGGLAGGLAAAGAKLVGGFDLVADEVGLDESIEHAALVVTGEGYLDAQSFDGKVVGGVMQRCAEFGVSALVVAGAVDDEVARTERVVSLSERFGDQRARADTVSCVREVVADELARRERVD